MATQLYNLPNQLNKRRTLRVKSTETEIIMWERLRDRKLKNIKFRRQYGVGPYIVDFYAPACRIAIEIDGSSHDGEEAQKRDRRRQKYIENCGIRFLRYTNDEVLGDVEKVLKSIAEHVERFKIFK